MSLTRVFTSENNLLSHADVALHTWSTREIRATCTSNTRRDAQQRERRVTTCANSTRDARERHVTTLATQHEADARTT